VSDNQWIRLSGSDGGINFAQARSITPDGDKAVVTWTDGTSTVYPGDQAKRILAWLGDQHLPVLRET